MLLGDDSVGEFHSVALTNNRQQADTGTKMIHIGKSTKSQIVTKGISAGRSARTPIAAWCRMLNVSAEGARNHTQCDCLLIGDRCGAHTVPYIEVKQPHRQRRARGDHLARSATTSCSTAAAAASPRRTRWR